jgi:predicted DsbA family dithiol-disulfide isomerase
MALASDKVTALTIEANEFPEMTRRYGVQGVPRTVVNRQGAFVGALPEQQFVASVLKLAGIEVEGIEPEDDALS